MKKNDGTEINEILNQEETDKMLVESKSKDNSKWIIIILVILNVAMIVGIFLSYYSFRIS